FSSSCLFLSFLLFSLLRPRSLLHSFPTRRSSDLWSLSVSPFGVNHAVFHPKLVPPSISERYSSPTYKISLGPKPAFSVAYSNTLDRKSTRLNSSHVSISYAVFCLKKKKNRNNSPT